MAVTTGLTAFNLDLNEIMEEAYERAGLEIRTGYEFRTGRRSLNMLTIEWANRGINLWTIEQGQIVMNTGQGIYPFPEDTIDLLDQVIRTQANDLNQIDINISRISESTYAMIPNKLAQGRPIQVWINRQTGAGNNTSVVLTTALTSTDTTVYVSDITQLAAAGFINVTTGGVTETIVYQNVNPVPLVGLPNAGQLLNCARGQNSTVAAAHAIAGTTIAVTNLPSINVWPTPNSPGDQYIFVYWRMRRLQDAGNGVNIQDIPFRLIPCLVAGLAFYIAQKKPEVSPDRVMFLKQEYEQQWLLASQEDREKAPDRFVPRQLFY
jgi:hypothetical protein